MSTEQGQRVAGWRAIFSVPKMYQLAQWGIGSPNVRKALADDYLRAKVGERVLDIGCGTGDMVTFLPHVDYTGYDLSEAYIKAAQERYGHLGDFCVASVNNSASSDPATFDKAFAKGVLHHLNDDDALALFANAKAALRSGGVLVTVDPCYVAGQSPIAKYLISKDRGLAVREVPHYERLARESFSHVEAVVHDDLLRVPYSHVFLVCTDAE